MRCGAWNSPSRRHRTSRRRPGVLDADRARTVGDIEFSGRTAACSSTAGNGLDIAPGLWTYNGAQWTELSNVCGASEGRIAWAGPDEFWTISDARPGQAANPNTGAAAPLADLSLCHFAGGEVIASYEPRLPGQLLPADGRGRMRLAADCWFGWRTAAGTTGWRFHLHWDGTSLTAEPGPQGHAVKDIRLFEGRLYESVKLAPGDRLTNPESPEEPPLLHRISPPGVQPVFASLSPGVPSYGPGVFPTALNYLHLSADGEALWGAAGPVNESELQPGSNEAELTVIRDSAGNWSEVVGPGGESPGALAHDTVSSIAAEPGSEAAWLALQPKTGPDDTATVARVSADGVVTDL